MALDKLVDSSQLDSDLNSVANAILDKSGATGPIAFPSGFLSTIAAIPGGGMKLLSSGSFVRTGTTPQNLTIPVTYTGTPKIVYVIVDAELSDINQALYVARYYTTSTDPVQVETDLFNGFAACRGKKSDNSYTMIGYNPLNVTLSETEVTFGRPNTTYIWRANTYNWYIYGEAST